ncbi:tetratricopeptide repeat protein [Roseivirga sp.]|uniref:tetratricopeptide repeat protein n=1 Tax=Roseivirga sp. TaxID=1964215 RepID=UPI003B52846F
MKKLIYIGLLIFGVLAFKAPKAVAAQTPGDSTNYLLLNMALQLQITDAVDNMYNFKFREAEVEFNWIKYNYPEHPLGYFLYGISTWWQMMPNLDKESPLGEEFLAYMDSTIMKAEAMYDRDEDNIEAAFFLAGAYGFEGRYHSEKKNWMRAAGAGKNALKYLEITQGNESFSPEVLFGDALFNYYSIWIRENYPMLRPVLFFFPKGDKELGLKQLDEVSKNAFYTRIEAIYFLMRIKAFERDETYDALRLGEDMHKKYPDNPYFHRFYARMLYTTGQYDAAAKQSAEILKRIEAGETGYEEVSGRYASFYLGHMSKLRGNQEEARKYFRQVIDYTESLIDEEDSGYYLYSQMYLAEYEVEEGLYDQALDRIDIIRDNTRRRDSLNEKARELKKVIRKRT